MIIPFWVLLIPTGIVVAFVLIFAFFNVLQVYRFGFFSAASLTVFAVFLVVIGIIALQTLQSVGVIDWSAPLFRADFGAASDVVNF